jgi:hypothetical protein
VTEPDPTVDDPEESVEELTRLVIPVPEVAGLVPGAHIALLDPFLELAATGPGVVSELREIFAEVVPFGYVLGEVARFPSGAAYLSPSPVGVFRRIAASVRRAFPEVVGHPTSLHGAIPHLALDDVAVEVIDVPLDAHAREALLLHGTGPDPDVLARFRFGTSAA